MKPPSRSRLVRLAGAAAFAAGSLLAAGSLATAAPRAAAAHAATPAAIRTYRFTTLDDQADPTFNQLLGINDSGVIAGYFGIGSRAHPNKGYTLSPPYGQGNYMDENFPGSQQTQVIGIDNLGNTAGFWVNRAGANFGFVEWNGVFQSVTDPRTTSKPKFDQLLGIDDAGRAVGFYNDAAGRSHGFEYDQATKKFMPVVPPGGAGSVLATGINSKGDIVGFVTRGGTTSSFLRIGKTYTFFEFPGSTNTQALGVDRQDQVVGSYVDAAGNMHGFILSHPVTGASFQTIDDPNGIGNTLVNGIDDKHQIVGFYVDGANNTDGFLGNPTS